MMWFTDPASALMKEIMNLHNIIMYYIVMIVIFVGWLLVQIVNEYGVKKTVNTIESWEDFMTKRKRLEENSFEAVSLETGWTILPSGILVVIAISSFSLMYIIDYISKVSLTLKVVGNQWYWGYEYMDIYTENTKGNNFDIKFDSYMIPEKDLKVGEKRLLAVDNTVVLPVNRSIRILVTAKDVLHSWAVPALGLKMDGVPGRLNQIELRANRTGIFYGQCSEICGVNHGFMPIKLQIVADNEFINWVINKKKER
jgi:cytochrome c oxidase subunit 2